MFQATPSERRHSVEVRIPLPSADMIELLGKDVRRPLELRITYTFAERWVNGQRQTVSRTTWKLVVTTALIPELGPGEISKVGIDSFKDGGYDLTPAWVNHLVEQNRP